MDKQIKNNEKTKLILYKDLQDSFIHIKVGNEQEPSNDEDINQIEAKITKLFEDNDVNCMVFVTHHAVDIRLIERQNK